jgi:hypothetical protein
MISGWIPAIAGLALGQLDAQVNASGIRGDDPAHLHRETL